MIKVIFPDEQLDKIVAICRQTELETFVLVLARPVEVSRGRWRLLAVSVHLPESDDYEIRTRSQVRPTATFRLPLEKRARLEGLSIIYCHSHPAQSGTPLFSTVDRQTERTLGKYARERVVGVPHVALLIGADGIAARELGTTNAVEVWQVGRDVRRHSHGSKGVVTDRFDRQVRAFGKDGQRAIESLRIGVVGCGGTGSIVVQELAYLGARDLLLIDPDRLTKTNLNRVVGATPADRGEPKVDIARRLVLQISPDATVIAKKGDVLRADVGVRLLDVDLIFGCTDSEGSRHFLNQLAYQYFIPVIDMGVSITPANGRIVSMDGRVQMLAPGLQCLICIDGTLDGRRVMWDLQNRQQRTTDPYFTELAGVKQPAVISLNGLVASQAVTVFLSAVTGIPVTGRLIRFRAVRGDARIQDTTPRAGCANCSDAAYLSKGNLYPLPERSH